MTASESLFIHIAFFAGYNFIDKIAGIGAAHGQPGIFHASKLPLQALEQAHKIPDGKNMVAGK